MKLPSMFCVLPFELFIAVQVETPIYIYSLHMIKIDFLALWDVGLWLLDHASVQAM